ncbi:hypothetical protein Tco_0424669 [Tanacetum coccineum]
MCPRSIQIIPGLLRARNRHEASIQELTNEVAKLKKYLKISWLVFVSVLIVLGSTEEGGVDEFPAETHKEDEDCQKIVKSPTPIFNAVLGLPSKTTWATMVKKMGIRGAGNTGKGKEKDLKEGRFVLNFPEVIPEFLTLSLICTYTHGHSSGASGLGLPLPPETDFPFSLLGPSGSSCLTFSFLYSILLGPTSLVLVAFKVYTGMKSYLLSVVPTLQSKKFDQQRKSAYAQWGLATGVEDGISSITTVLGRRWGSLSGLA